MKRRDVVHRAVHPRSQRALSTPTGNRCLSPADRSRSNSRRSRARRCRKPAETGGRRGVRIRFSGLPWPGRLLPFQRGTVCSAIVTETSGFYSGRLSPVQGSSSAPTYAVFWAAGGGNFSRTHCSTSLRRYRTCQPKLCGWGSGPFRVPRVDGFHRHSVGLGDVRGHSHSSLVIPTPYSRGSLLTACRSHDGWRWRRMSSGHS